MKAAVLEHYGSPDEFRIKEIPTPEIKDGQILIRNHASSVNPVDTIVRSGKTRLVTGILGDQLIGSDFSGTVIDSKSVHFKKGDEVFGLNVAFKGGSYAQEIVAEEDTVTFKPANLSFTEAASLPLVGLTAWQGLVTEGKIKKGDRVLITGCTGGVGMIAVQIAKTFDAIVTGTCSEKNIDFAKSLGVDNVIIYDKQDIPKEEKFDLIFDASGNFTISDLKGNLTDEAFFVSTKGGMEDFKSTVDGAIDLVFQKRMKLVMLKANTDDLETLRKMAEEGKVKPHIAQSFPLEHLADAHKMMEEGGFNGKIAIEIN
jgi:NADPH:quinone reductase-like Zn-dependent oxidoreductase